MSNYHPLYLKGVQMMK